MTVFRQEKQIGFLVDRKFPLRRPYKAGGPGVSQANRRKYLAEADAYESELWTRSSEDVATLYAEEQRRAIAEREEQQRLEERKAFYNQRAADADTDFWGKMPSWSLDEAVALSFGKNPKIINWKTVSGLTLASTFSQEFERRRELCLRAASIGALFDPVLPPLFISWADSVEMPIPESLRQAVHKYSENYADWKSLYEEQSTLLQEALSRNEELLNQIEQLQEALTAESAKEREPGTRERESLLKMVIGMAKGYYGYDSSKLRNEATGEIQNDLEKAGVSLSDDTIRKWLREAAELLPPDSDPKS